MTAVAVGVSRQHVEDFLYGACLRDWDAERERMSVGGALDLHLTERGGRELDCRRERQGRELLALRLLHGLGLLLGEFAERTEEILGIPAAEREEAATAFHATAA